MKRTAAGFGIGTLLAMWVTTPIGAQVLELGTWTGTMFPPQGEASVDVRYDVGEKDGYLTIVMTGVPDQGMSIVFNEVMLDGDQLIFWWEPGSRVDCTLLPREDGIFEGICTDGSGPDGEGTLRMVPPSGTSVGFAGRHRQMLRPFHLP